MKISFLEFVVDINRKGFWEFQCMLSVRRPEDDMQPVAYGCTANPPRHQFSKIKPVSFQSSAMPPRNA